MTPEKAINCLNILRMYAGPRDWQIAIEVAKEALEKQMPKNCNSEVINRGIDINGEYDIDANILCPICNTSVGDAELGELHKYCPECGQKLDWSDDGEATRTTTTDNIEST